MLVLLDDLDKMNQLYESVAQQMTSLNASSSAWSQLNRLNVSMEAIAVSLLLSHTQTHKKKCALVLLTGSPDLNRVL